MLVAFKIKCVKLNCCHHQSHAVSVTIKVGFYAWLLIFLDPRLLVCCYLMYICCIMSNSIKVYSAILLLMLPMFFPTFVCTFSYTHSFTCTQTTSTTIFISCTLFSKGLSFTEIIKRLFKRFIFIVVLILVLVCLTVLAPLLGHVFVTATINATLAL